MISRSIGFAPLLAAITLLAFAPKEVLAQDNYPSRPIRIIVPTSPGSGNDTVARLLAQRLSEIFRRQVLVDNRAGAGTIIGTEIVAKAPPDGYTLLSGNSAFTINPSAYKKLPYDAIRDFVPITHAVSVPSLIVVHPSVPAKSVKELIALAKARPGELLYASSGHGTNPHLTMELFTSMAQIRMTHVPYKGSSGLIDVVAGHVQVLALSMSTLMPHVRAGKLRALGVTSVRRTAAAPDIPTIAEAGLPGYESVQWTGLLAPAGTPRDVIVKLHGEIVGILRTPEVRDRLAGDGSDVIANSPEEFGAFIKAEIVKWANVAKAAGIQPE